jgi:hypothetical protein
MAQLEAGRVIEIGGLLRQCIDDLFATMARVDTPQARSAVQYSTSVQSGVVHTLGLRQKTRLFFKLPICGKGHPQIREVREIRVAGHDYLRGQVNKREVIFPYSRSP